MANPTTKIPLVTDGLRNYDSDGSRAELINLYPEKNNNGSFRSLRRTEGLTVFISFATGPIRSNFLVQGSLSYVVSGTQLYSFSGGRVITDIGFVGSSSSLVVLRQNAAPDGPQILILNGDGAGNGFTYTASTKILTPIDDVDFLGAKKGDILNEQFVLVEPVSTRFYLSDVSDGSSYTASVFGSAEQSPDDLVNLVAKKSFAWMFGTKTTEKWQTFNDPSLPLRPSTTSTIERGVLAPDSVAKLDDYIGWLADDGTVRMIQNAAMVKISDLDLELRIQGNGTLRFPGFTIPSNAKGWWVDGPIHKIYYLTFPSDNYTWGFDLTTGQSHSRSSTGLDFWQAFESVLFSNRVLVGNIDGPNVFELDPGNRTENGTVMRTSLTTPPMRWDQNVTIPLIELDMEVGEIDDPLLEPVLLVSYSKDGVNFINWGEISLGRQGDTRRRVPMRNFGQVIRNKDFSLRFETVDPVEIRYYGCQADIRKSVL